MRPVDLRFFSEGRPAVRQAMGGALSWNTLLDADFSGSAGPAMADGDTLVRSGVTWTLRAQNASFQTWTPATDGVDLAVTNGTSTTNGLLADIADAAILGRDPDDYDALAVQALWTNVTQTASGSALGVAMGREDTGVARAGMNRSLVAGHLRAASSLWLARVSRADGTVQAERSLATSVADPSVAPVVTGGLFLPGLGAQVFGAIDRATLYAQPIDLRGVSIFREPGSTERPQIDRVGAFVVTFGAVSTTATLSRLRIQHYRMPGAPEPS